MLPAIDASAPFGKRIAIDGVCSNESGIDKSNSFIKASVTEGRNPRLRSAEDQRVDVVRAFVGVHYLEIHHVANHAELVGYPVASHHVARHPRDVKGFAAGIALEDGRDFGRRG